MAEQLLVKGHVLHNRGRLGGGGHVGHATCSCGKTSVYTCYSDKERQRWHRSHREEIVAANPATPTASIPAEAKAI